MAHSCLFMSNLCYAVLLKRNLKVPTFKYYFAYIHKHVSQKQCEATEKSIHGSFDSKFIASENHKETDLETLKLKILQSSLTFVPEYGWSEKALAFGAKSLGVSAASHTLIQGGGPELVHYFNFSCNSKLEDCLKDLSTSNQKINLEEYLTNALDNRLRMIIPYLSKWSEAMALMTLPTQIPEHTKNVLDLVDSIWHFYGDVSTDTSWYTKRIALAVAYKTAELSLIQDKSSDFSDTFTFLQRRVENVVEAENLVYSVKENGKHFLEFGSGALITARNLLGLNRWFR